MQRVALVLGLVLACGTQQPAETTGKEIVHDCGDAPLAPGWSVGFDQTTGAATMSATDYANIKAWRSSVEDWETCVISHP